jgi:predicted nucleic acid-binding protein/predicted HTH domain antitoxin
VRNDRIAVVDASAFIALTQIDRLDLLTGVFDRVLTTPEVVREAARTMPGLPGWVVVVDAVAMEAPVCAAELGAGEQRAIALAGASAGAVFVSDDDRARRCARSIGTAVRGCAGVVVDAKRRGLIARARPVLDELIRPWSPRPCARPAKRISDGVVRSATLHIANARGPTPMSTTLLPIDDALLAVLAADGQDPARALHEAAVLELYRRDAVSAGQAADLLGMSKWDFIRWSGERGVPYVRLTPQELADDVRRLETFLQR